MKISPRVIPILFLFAYSCATTRVQVENFSGNAYAAFTAGDYETALINFEQFIANQRSQSLLVHDTIYRMAGWSAFRLGQDEKALSYLLNIRNSPLADDRTFYALAILNRKIDNLSRELSALENYANKYPEGEHIDKIRTRLFHAYVESRNYQGAYELWPAINEKSRGDEAILKQYFTVVKAFEKDEQLNDIAQKLLAINPLNSDALFYFGKLYFDKAEERYQAEMEAYERNRTHRQYAQLLRGFEILTADFRKSLEYMLILYENDPQPRFARYIGNIYLRFDDKTKARYYHDRSGN